MFSDDESRGGRGGGRGGRGGRGRGAGVESITEGETST